MRLPVGLVGEPRPWFRPQTGDRGRWQALVSHVVICGIVQHVIGMAGAQQIQEVQPAFRRPGAKPCEPVIADLRAKAVLPLWRAPVSVRQTPSGTSARFANRSTDTNGDVSSPARKTSWASVTKPSCLSVNRRCNCRFEIDTPTDRNKANSRGSGRLPLMVLHQNEATEFRAKMAIDPLWQRCQDRSPIRRDPAFALVTGRANRDHQVLNQKRLVALEARSRRDHGFDHLIFNADPRRHLATAPPLLKRDRASTARCLCPCRSV